MITSSLNFAAASPIVAPASSASHMIPTRELCRRAIFHHTPPGSHILFDVFYNTPIISRIKWDFCYLMNCIPLPLFGCFACLYVCACCRDQEKFRIVVSLHSGTGNRNPGSLQEWQTLFTACRYIYILCSWEEKKNPLNMFPYNE